MSVMLHFDKDLAKLAVEVETGKIVTAAGEEVKIIDWNGNNPIYPIEGYVGSLRMNWTDEGKLLDCSSDDNYPLDLRIKISDELWL